jgi:hypothetical protein
MADFTITGKLAERLANLARQENRTVEQVIDALLTQYEKDAAFDRLLKAADELAALQPPLSPEEIEAEIDAYRKEKK